MASAADFNEAAGSYRRIGPLLSVDMTEANLLQWGRRPLSADSGTVYMKDALADSAQQDAGGVLHVGAASRAIPRRASMGPPTLTGG